MREAKWNVEEIKEYFGEYFKSEEEAIEAMEEVEKYISYKSSYLQHMAGMRELLKERGHDVVYRTGYRRVGR